MHTFDGGGSLLLSPLTVRKLLRKGLLVQRVPRLLPVRGRISEREEKEIGNGGRKGEGSCGGRGAGKGVREQEREGRGMGHRQTHLPDKTRKSKHFRFSPILPHKVVILNRFEPA